jgi:hypothetical protein
MDQRVTLPTLSNETAFDPQLPLEAVCLFGGSDLGRVTEEGAAEPLEISSSRRATLDIISSELRVGFRHKSPMLTQESLEEVLVMRRRVVDRRMKMDVIALKRRFRVETHKVHCFKVSTAPMTRVESETLTREATSRWGEVAVDTGPTTINILSDLASHLPAAREKVLAETIPRQAPIQKPSEDEVGAYATTSTREGPTEELSA